MGIANLRKGERGIWQRRFWEHLIRDEADYARMSNIAASIRSSTGYAGPRLAAFVISSRRARRNVSGRLGRRRRNDRRIRRALRRRGATALARGLWPGAADYAFGSNPPYALKNDCVGRKVASRISTKGLNGVTEKLGQRLSYQQTGNWFANE